MYRIVRIHNLSTSSFTLFSIKIVVKKIYAHSVQRKFLLVGDMTSSTYNISIWHKRKILTENVPNYFKVFALLTQEVEAITRCNDLLSCMIAR